MELWLIIEEWRSVPKVLKAIPNLIGESGLFCVSSFLLLGKPKTMWGVRSPPEIKPTSLQAYMQVARRNPSNYCIDSPNIEWLITGSQN